MTRDNLERFQDTYAEAMAKYEMRRGVKNSESRHTSSLEYYRDITANKQALKDEIEDLQETKESRQQEVAELDQQEQDARIRTAQATTEKQQAETELVGKQSELRQVKSELKTEKFKNSAAEMGSTLMDGINSALGTPKVKRQQQEIEMLRSENAELKMQLASRDMQIRTLHRDHQSDIERLRQTHDRDMTLQQKELDRITFWFPYVPQMAAQADYCREVGFSQAQTRELLTFRPVQYTGKLRSPKSGRSYEADNVTARLERPSGSSGSRLTLTINGTPILQWFKQQFEKLKQVIQPRQSRGRGI
jgi:predicted  nucleic acid-binding Zn-ribbon protein